jgi:hypothetical protein
VSLINQLDCIEIFLQSGERFLASPDPINGMEFDDAVVALKRHAHVVMKDAELAAQLQPLGRMIREREVQALQPLFDALRQRLEK